MNKILKYSAFAGILSLLTLFPLIVFEVLKSLNKLTGILITYYIITILISFLSYLLFVYGYVLIGKYSKNNLLKVISIISLVFAFILDGYYIASLYIPKLEGLAFYIGVILSYGVIELTWGISILKLKKLFGGLATGMGVLLIITGASFITVILSIIGIVLEIPVYIIGVMILFKASKKF